MPPFSRESARVLLAGPEPALALYHAALAAAGMQIVADCTTQEQVIASLAKTRPDVCVVDRDFEGGGLVAAATIASPRRAPRVLLVGGSGSAAEVRAARLAGAAESLPGEVDPPDLVAAVSALIREVQR
jgi:DNA-binding NarL/FixJ family response regulator